MAHAVETPDTGPPKGRLYEKYSYSEALQRYFPYGTAEVSSVFKVDDRTVRVCASEQACKDYVHITDEPNGQFISGPFVADVAASWLDISKKGVKLCAIFSQNSNSSCVRLELPVATDIEISYKRKGPFPTLSVASNNHSTEYLEWYGHYLKRLVFGGGKLLHRLKAEAAARPDGGNVATRSNDEMSPQSEDIPIVVIDGPSQPIDPGGGGGIIIVPINPGGGGPDPGGGGGGGGASNPCGCEPTPEEKSEGLRKCLALNEYLYYERDIPRCKEVFPGLDTADSRNRAICYAEAVNDWADNNAWCKDRWK